MIIPGKGFQNTSNTSIKKPSITPNPPQAAPVGIIVDTFQFQNTYNLSRQPEEKKMHGYARVNFIKHTYRYCSTSDRSMKYLSHEY